MPSHRRFDSSPRRWPAVTLASLLAAALHPIASGAIILRHDRAADPHAKLAAPYADVVGHLGDRVACTLVAPRWALGAAHTIEDYFDPPNLPTVTFAGRRYSIDKVILHPGRVRGAVDSDADLALLRLATPVEGVTPALLYERGDEVGKVVRIVGRGASGTGLAGSCEGERGRLLAAENRVEAVFEHSLVFTFDTPPAGLELEGISGAGDSGAPALVEEDGKLYTLGVGVFNSGEEGSACAYGTLDAFARVSAHRQWILDTMAEDPPSTLPLFTGFTAAREPRELPATPAGAAARAALAAFASAEPERVVAFYRQHGRRRSEEELQSLGGAWDELLEQYGSYEIRGFSAAGPHALAVFVRASKGGVERAWALVLDPAGEGRVQRMWMADVPTPAAPSTTQDPQ